MENQTWIGDFLLLEGLKVTPQSSIPVFIVLFSVYIFIMLSNIGLTVLISVERSLHQPMYLLSCNLNINDVFGATAILPRLISDIFTESAERYITYMGCVVQAFFFHLHIGTYLSVLMIGLSVRLSRCRRMVSNPFCDNASLFKLSCESVLINNIYGLGYTVVILGSSIGSTILTYLKITIACLTSKNRALNSRALQTCSTHLTLYLIMILSGLSSIALHRFPELSEQRKWASIVTMLVPPALNAVIYGLQIKQIRQKIVTLFNKNIVTLSLVTNSK
ncbi:olfactory receptor 5AR1-like [Gadus chalcogrammus]|uniref:olfactory receptor 5AR1-like n=1 Tax=Gadus chalcogrammus TaxID=1042646 RepID=UPI0024C233ED|nr:olfactory receptor 5AR1-like [Gadus chalcogrammus]